MTPLEALLEWFNTLSEQAKKDIAFSLVMTVFDDVPYTVKDDPLPFILTWLGEEDLGSPNVVCRVLRFRSSFEYGFSGRFTGAGWVKIESAMRDIVEVAGRDPESIEYKLKRTAFPMLADLPARKEEWRQIGISWRELRSAYLSDEALSAWGLTQVGV